MLNSKDMEYRLYTLGDIGVIELLIAFRYKYDDNLFMDDSIPMAVSGAARVNEEVICTYASLDQTIKRCNFSQQQLDVVRLISEGYSYSEIGFELNLHRSSINKRLKTIYKRIHRENEQMWRKSMYEDKLGLKSKKCGKCKEELPATVEFYSPYDKSNDGFFNYCKGCR